MRFLPLAASLLVAGGCVAAPRPASDLVAAVRSGDAATIRTLATRGADLNAPSGGNGWTPLLHAVHKNQIRSVQALLDAGADVNRAGNGGMTPLMMAAGYGYAGIVELLIRRGARTGLVNEAGETALDMALSGMTDIDRWTFFDCQDSTVRALLAAGATRHASPSARRWASVKRCESASLLR